MAVPFGQTDAGQGVKAAASGSFSTLMVAMTLLVAVLITLTVPEETVVGHVVNRPGESGDSENPWGDSAL